MSDMDQSTFEGMVQAVNALMPSVGEEEPAWWSNLAAVPVVPMPADQYRPYGRVNSRYIKDGLELGKEEVIDKLIAQLQHKQFDAVAFRGVSGALVAPVIAYMMKKPLIAVRKDEPSHADRGRIVESGIEQDEFTYIIVDDFVSTGTTLAVVMAEIAKVFPKAKCLGAALWYDTGSTSPTCPTIAGVPG
jgi:hypothetical protein